MSEPSSGPSPSLLFDPPLGSYIFSDESPSSTYSLDFEMNLDQEFEGGILEGPLSVVSFSAGFSQAKARAAAELKKRLGKARDRVSSETQRVIEKIRTGKMRRQRHKLCYMLAFFDVIASTYLFALSPADYYIQYHSVKILLLFAMRLCLYRWQNWHYYLFDFCYFHNIWLLIWLWLIPEHSPWKEPVWEAVQGFSGVMLVSVVLFRNSYVLHSLDRVTSSHLHLGPPLVVLSLRSFHPRWASSPLPSLFPAMVLYLVWAVPYIMKMFVWDADYIMQKGLETSHRLCRSKYQSGLPWPLNVLDDRVVFMLLHASSFLISWLLVLLPSYIQWGVYTCFLGVCVHNGGGYYIDYFWKVYEQNAKRYLDEVRIREKREGEGGEGES